MLMRFYSHANLSLANGLTYYSVVPDAFVKHHNVLYINTIEETIQPGHA